MRQICPTGHSDVVVQVHRPEVSGDVMAHCLVKSNDSQASVGAQA